MFYVINNQYFFFAFSSLLFYHSSSLYHTSALYPYTYFPFLIPHPFFSLFTFLFFSWKHFLFPITPVIDYSTFAYISLTFFCFGVYSKKHFLTSFSLFFPLVSLSHVCIYPTAIQKLPYLVLLFPFIIETGNQ